ncbi:hypothetical protein P3X46_011431 [Hevea brasiliensis]|uniref:Uncharacterized protein n=1 Tax=Hevea brasiliensis TaxID=3981 RepID=A0ABQ9M7B8_HEVBR|nr:GDSL esterase/lipase At2g30310 [Hevea brasiliensis]KAJ9176081.1 hypothetical protein P3X46_011431 [Hevea brasiliensis]
MAAPINLCLVWAIFFFCNCNSLPSFPSILIFGDSLVDTGNNNYIKTILKAKYLPYGQDYPGNLPTGRFSNGKLIPDILASALGIKDSVPPFLDPTLSEHDLITGVNFASAGAGFDDLTTTLSNAIQVSKQIELFKVYVEKLKGIVGEGKAKEIINGALVILNAGTNDWLLNYYDIPTRKLQFNATGYRDFLLNDKLQIFITELYELGCRRMVVSGLPPIGVIPFQMKTVKLENPLAGESWLEDQNRDSGVYNEELVKLLTRLQATLPGTKLVYNDLYEPVMDMITQPDKYGYVETKKGCCKSTILLCHPLASTCKSPSKFLFWDMIHPTFTSNQYLVKYILKNVIPKFL